MLRGETPSEAERRELAEHFDDGQLVELTTAIALFLGFSKIAVALGPPPDMPVQVIPTPGWPPGDPRPATERLTGRPRRPPTPA